MNTHSKLTPRDKATGESPHKIRACKLIEGNNVNFTSLAFSVQCIEKSACARCVVSLPKGLRVSSTIGKGDDESAAAPVQAASPMALLLASSSSSTNERFKNANPFCLRKLASTSTLPHSCVVSSAPQPFGCFCFGSGSRLPRVCKLSKIFGLWEAGKTDLMEFPNQANDFP